MFGQGQRNFASLAQGDHPSQASQRDRRPPILLPTFGGFLAELRQSAIPHPAAHDSPSALREDAPHHVDVSVTVHQPRNKGQQLREEDSRLADEQNQLELQHRRITHRRNQIAEQRDQLIEELTKQLDELIEDRRRLTMQRDWLHNEHHQLTEQRDRLSAQVGQLTQQLQQITLERDQIDEKYDNALREREELHAECIGLGREVNGVRDLLMQYIRRSADATHDGARIRYESHKITRELNQSRMRHRQALKVIKERDKTIEERNQDIQTCDQSIQDLQKRLNDHAAIYRVPTPTDLEAVPIRIELHVYHGGPLAKSVFEHPEASVERLIPNASDLQSINATVLGLAALCGIEAGPTLFTVQTKFAPVGVEDGFAAVMAPGYRSWTEKLKRQVEAGQVDAARVVGTVKVYTTVKNKLSTDEISSLRGFLGPVVQEF
ncbi:uncharacterized protein HMPREF1541_02975 [Cyphellophora europaea CBS 101466]|uniref:Uncharacterized protein n=1 Tax=Cyphellophora europaea (strain CBS 101466) TaxID=1220924 RepID=W2RX11_CYPE1|nr:uncharacterized protein HMPREF1541_02975 [Cyphellophora europaea CBS 101466]ETN41041.1 hypothetical protein HMPREF1541_02975 [Cyphellophora europaea CBS 101466]